MLLQMPIFIAMFLFVPGAIEMRGEAFLWAHDLSTYDAIIRFPYIWGIGSHLSLFTLLMTGSTLLLTYYTSQGQASMQGPNKYIMYIMPVMFIFVLNSSPAGLSFYYLVQNVFSVAQQWAISKYFIDKDKIRLGYEEFKKNNKDKASGKTKMQIWLEEAQRKAQERAEAQRAAKNNKSKS
jgi:YidC/Oxa1 family membrane protein insertase